MLFHTHMNNHDINMLSPINNQTQYSAYKDKDNTSTQNYSQHLNWSLTCISSSNICIGLGGHRCCCRKFFSDLVIHY